MILFIGQISAQKTAFDYLNQAPSMPDSVCSCKKEIRQNYETNVRNLIDVVSEDSHKRSRANNNYIDQNRDQINQSMMNQMAEKTGMSPEELEALKNKKNMSKEDKQNMANKMLNQYGLSMDEVKEMKKMDPNAKKAWAQGYATEQMARVKMNQRNAQTNDNKSMDNFKILQEQQQMQNQITVFENDVKSRYDILIQNSGKEKLNADLEKLNNELRSIKTIYECNECPAPPSKDIEHWNSVKQKIKDTKKQYCRQNTAKFMEYLKWYKQNLSLYIPMYDKAEEIQFKVTSSTTGTQLTVPGKGVYSLQAVEAYLKSLLNLFQFKNYEIESLSSDFYH